MQPIEATQKNVQKKHFYDPITSLILTIVIFFGAQLIASFFLFFILKLTGFSDGRLDSFFKQPAGQFVFVFIADSLVFGSLVWLVKRKKSTLKELGLAWPRINDVGRALLAYGIYILLFIVLTAIAKAVYPALDLEQEQQIGFEANQGVFNLLLAGISLVVLPPIIEELLCRGFLYTGLRSRLNAIPAAIITSIVFAGAHLQFGSGVPLLWVAAIDTFVLSLVLVYLRETSGRLAAPMLLHGLKNAIAFSLLFIFL